MTADRLALIETSLEPDRAASSPGEHFRVVQIGSPKERK